MMCMLQVCGLIGGCNAIINTVSNAATASYQGSIDLSLQMLPA